MLAHCSSDEGESWFMLLKPWLIMVDPGKCCLNRGYCMLLLVRSGWRWLVVDDEYY